MDGSVLTLIITISIDVVIFSLEFYMFSQYRKVRNKPVYLELEGRDIKVPVFSESDTSLTELFRGVWNVPFDEIGFYCGLEGKLYLALQRVLAQSIAIMMLIGCIVLIPIYVYGDSEINKQMNAISMAHIIGNDDLMAVVLVYFIIFTFAAFGIILFYMRQVSKAYSMPSELICTINKYVIEIRGIPNDINPKDAAIDLKDIMCEQFPGSIQSVYVVPNLSSAFALHLQIEEAKKEIYHYQEYLKYKKEKATYKEHFYSDPVDAIEHFQQVYQELRKLYDVEYEKNKDLCAGYAYALAKSPLEALNIVNNFKASSTLLNCNHWKITIAPAPSEINWQNVNESRKSIWIVRMLLLATFIIFFFLLITPSTFLQIMVEILGVLGVTSVTSGLLSYILPSLILLLYQSAIVRHTVLAIVQREGLGNKSEETVSAMLKYLLVMITYMFIVPLVGLQVYSIITDTFVGDFSGWKNGIANQAAYSGLFFTVYITHLIFLKNGSDFMQIPKYVRVKFRQMRAVNERENLMAYEAYEFRWAYEYGVTITSLVIILSFSVAYPLIMVFGVVLYTTRYFTAKYNLLCFYCTVKTTTGHKIPKVITTAMLVAILIFQVFTCALIFLSHSKIYFASATLLLIFSILLFIILYIYRDKIEAELQQNMKLENLEDEGIVFGEDISKYYHPLETSGYSRILIKEEKIDSDNQLS